LKSWLWGILVSLLSALVSALLAPILQGWSIVRTLFNWLIGDGGWVAAVAEVYDAVFGFLFDLLPSGTQGTIADFITWFQENAGVLAALRLVRWLIDQFCDVAVLTACLAAFFGLIPVLIFTRLLIWVYVKVWGST